MQENKSIHLDHETAQACGNHFMLTKKNFSHIKIKEITNQVEQFYHEEKKNFRCTIEDTLLTLEDFRKDVSTCN